MDTHCKQWVQEHTLRQTHKVSVHYNSCIFIVSAGGKQPHLLHLADWLQ